MKYPIAFVAVAALVAAACSRPGEDERAFQWTSQLPAGAVVHLRDGAGDIAVKRAEGQSVQISGSRRWRRGHSNDIKFTVNQVGNDYYVCAMWRGSGKCGSSGYRGRQTNSFLTMFSLFHRNSDASADFTAEIPANVVVDARTSNGSVQIDGMSAGVTAHTTNGTVNASNVSGPLALSTTNGDVRLTTDVLADADPVSLSTTNGTIRAELPPKLEGAFDLSVVNGLVRTDLPLESTGKGRPGRHFLGQIGALTRVVKVRAVNGNVSVVTRATPVTH
ncbi:MAG TPA: DUF4097 family beta strand repeat-containing protein [Gemmatimonadaceae bacterium]|nr:DUF4097 family beta strand repeat-containing protein [Gemmatimonadaceae bacterium]